MEVRDRHNQSAAVLETAPGGDALALVRVGDGYTLTARKAGYAPGRLTAVSVGANGETLQLMLDLGPSAALPGAAALGGFRLFVAHLTPRLTLIDAASNLLLRHSEPLGSGRSTLVAISSDHSRLYATWTGSQQVFILRASDLALLDTVQVGPGLITALSVHPRTDRLWVASQTPQTIDAQVPAQLLELGGADFQPERQFALPAPASGLLFRQDGQLLYLLHRAGSAISLFRVREGDVASTLRVGQWPTGAALSSDGQFLYLVTLGSDRMTVLDADSGEVRRAVDVGQGAAAILPHPDGKRLFVANQPLGYVQVIDLDAAQVIDIIPVGRNPNGLALHPSQAALYVANSGSGSVSLVDLGKHAVVDTIAVGGSPLNLLLAQ